MVAVSFFWLLALPHQNYSKEVYLSENALLPGGVSATLEGHLSTRHVAPISFLVMLTFFWNT